MTRWSSWVAEWALMVLISALLFVEFFRLNEFLFLALEHAHGISWVFLPAGFRVLLVLILGLPGAIGIAVGTVWLNFDPAGQTLWGASLAMAMASGFGPWLVKRWMEERGWLCRELTGMTSASLLHFVLVYAAVNAISHQGIFWGFAIGDSRPWIDVWPMFIGDMVGALIVLYTFKLCLPWLRQWLRSGH